MGIRLLFSSLECSQSVELLLSEAFYCTVTLSETEACGLKAPPFCELKAQSFSTPPKLCTQVVAYKEALVFPWSLEEAFFRDRPSIPTCGDSSGRGTRAYYV